MPARARWEGLQGQEKVAGSFSERLNKAGWEMNSQPGLLPPIPALLSHSNHKFPVPNILPAISAAAAFLPQTSPIIFF